MNVNEVYHLLKIGNNCKIGSDIKHKLFEISLAQVWCKQEYVHFATHYPLIMQRLIFADKFIQNLV